MTERPILFNGAMVRAILDGRKVQTRRVMKQAKVLLPEAVKGDWPIGHHIKADPGIHTASLNPQGAAWIQVGGEKLGIRPCEFEWHSPFGRPGDRLWVRETWYCDDFRCKREPSPTELIPAFRDALEFREGHDCTAWEAECPCNDGTGKGSWRPSIFMPRWASRIHLEVTGVRVERVQEISEEDAKAEGLHCLTKDDGQTYKYGLGCAREGWPGSGREPDGWKWTDWNEDPRMAFAFLWNSINADRGLGWETNPFVWVVDFKRIEA